MAVSSTSYVVRHGHALPGAVSPTYKSWENMKNRCDNFSSDRYPYYGGRGIFYVPQWSSFEVFLADMGVRPPGTSLDRRNNDGPYSPDNCRWATKKEQARNRRRSRMFEYGGRVQCLSAWAEEYGIPYARLAARIDKLGWPFERAIAAGDLRSSKSLR